MELSTKTGVFGTDSKNPLYDPNPFWREISINDMFNAGAGLNKIIPQVGWHIRDPEIYATYKVISIDEITFKPQLERIYPDGMSFELSTTDRLFGVGFGRQSDVYRLHVNMNVYPYLACVDSACKVSGSLCKYARVFKVNDAGEMDVISKVYDSSGRFVSDKIPLELVQIDKVQNISTKVVPPFKFTTPLKDNDLIVVYMLSDNGNIVSKQELLVEESAFVRSIDASLKYVSHISLKSPYLSLTEDHVINYPLNQTAASLNLKGVVHYSNGDQKEYDIDGGKFRVEGLTQLLSSIEGQTRDILAFYSLDSNEGTFNGTGTTGRIVKADYKLKVSNDNISYSVKLFPVLMWGGDIYGYSVKWYLLNMDRTLIYDVTNKIEWMESTGAFNPLGFGYVQRKQVSLNLRSVSAAFQNFNHTQVVDFTLFGKPTATNGTPWTIKTESDVNAPTYGTGNVAYKVGDRNVDIMLGETSYTNWLTRMYYNSSPLVDSRIETVATTPTHFKVEYNGTSSVYSVREWDKMLDLGTTAALDGNLIITFINRGASGDMYLSVTGLGIRNRL